MAPQDADESPEARAPRLSDLVNLCRDLNADRAFLSELVARRRKS
jgi:hypothetical protein